MGEARARIHLERKVLPICKSVKPDKLCASKIQSGTDVRYGFLLQKAEIRNPGLEGCQFPNKSNT